jgi:23S rRNA (cytosine1962-C5)-methyltransferase
MTAPRPRSRRGAEPPPEREAPSPPEQDRTESDPESGAAPRTPPEARRAPWVELKTFSYHPTLYRAMIRAASPDAAAGSLVTVYDREGRVFGAGLWNPRARVPLRVLRHGEEAFGEEELAGLLDRAVEFRARTLGLGGDPSTNAYRVIHSDADSLSGLVVDRFADTLSVSVHSLGMFQRLPKWLPRLHEKLGTRRAFVDVDERAARLEGIPFRRESGDAVRTVKIQEHGIRYEVDFETGHKTGFFCDQRENRRRLARHTRDRRVLDLCCYTGGFALSAKILGNAGETTGVDLDEKAIERAKRNANLNQARIQWVHCDAFTWARQMQRNRETWDVVVLDPPKLVFDREDAEGGRKKYEDLNMLALSLTRPGGVFVTCSCSGMVSEEEFERMVIRAAHRLGRRIQFFDRTGAGPDHPVMSNCPESRYLKVLWGIAW